MDGKQLELPFNIQIQAALTAPKTSSVKSLWASLESQLCQLPDEAQLQTGAQAIAQLATLIEAKATELLGEWEQRYSPVAHEPILDAALLAGVLRQSMQLNLEDALQPYTPHYSPRERPSLPIQSVVQAMPKGDLLDLIEEETRAYERAIAVAHDEDVSAWVGAIAQYLHRHLGNTVESVRLVDLQQAMNRPLVELWLGLLLGNIASLYQSADDFYAPSGVYVAHWSINDSDEPGSTSE
ncbi:MAG: hypothetical protein IGR76_10845 [Synechococcales cyanobacterium T60_A2020_003]|nr:hypothetical protein [Synechococcales cyanobacterium T60_A2020_003]